MSAGKWIEAEKESMKKQITVLTLCATLFALYLPVEAQQPTKIFRIGFLDRSTAAGMAGLLEEFRHELNKLGWVDGKNITIEYRFGEQKNERLAELAAELVRLKVDLICGHGGGRRRWPRRKRLLPSPS